MDLKNMKITLPTEKQVFGNNRLYVIKKFKRKCAVTDFAIALGAYASDCYHVYYDDSLKGRTCPYFLASSNDYGDVLIVNQSGYERWDDASEKSNGIRPVIPFDDISSFSSDLVKGSNGDFEIEYGEYPQYVVSTDMGLEKAYKKGLLRTTGKTYTTDARIYYDNSFTFKPVEHEEYEYNGKKYVRIYHRGQRYIILSNHNALSNGYEYKTGDYVWIEVSPLIWYVDNDAKLLLSKNIVASGIRFCNDRTYNGNFKETEMYEFLNTYFKKDIIPSVIIEKPVKSSLLSRIFNKKDKSTEDKIEQEKVEDIKSIEPIESRNDIEKLMEDIEYKLNILRDRNKNAYLKYKNQYNEILNQHGNVLKLQDLNFDTLAKLLADIETSINFSKKSPVNIINYLEELKQEYINNIMNNNLEKTKVTVDELDELMKSFLLEKDEYDILTQREIIRKLSLIYLLELKENIDSIDINKIKKSYINSSIKSILSSISELENDGLIKSNNSFDIEDLSLENLLNIIKNIEFNKEKVIKKHKSKCDFK